MRWEVLVMSQKKDGKGIEKQADRNDLLLFLVLTFGLAYTGGILFSLKGAGQLSAAYMMILPAVSVGIIKERKKASKDNYSKLHYIMFSYFIVITLLNLLFISDVVRNMDGIKMAVQWIGSGALLLYSWIACPDLMRSEERNKVYITAPLIMIFALLAGDVLSGPMVRFNVVTYIFSCLSILPSFAINGIGFLGEEYGWRGFLQGKLQRKIGKRLGIILLGIIWEAWHLPLWFGIYQVKELGLIVLIVRFVHTTCMDVFLGWVYMKTCNLWLCALVHYINNSMAGSVLLSIRGMVTASLVVSVIMGVFILTKEYRRDDLRIRNERIS